MSEYGGANCRLEMTMLHFSFKSARGANYRKYGILFSAHQPIHRFVGPSVHWSNLTLLSGGFCIVLLLPKHMFNSFFTAPAHQYAT